MADTSRYRIRPPRFQFDDDKRSAELDNRIDGLARLYYTGRLSGNQYKYSLTENGEKTICDILGCKDIQLIGGGGFSWAYDIIGGKFDGGVAKISFWKYLERQTQKDFKKAFEKEVTVMTCTEKSLNTASMIKGAHFGVGLDDDYSKTMNSRMLQFDKHSFRSRNGKVRSFRIRNGNLGTVWCILGFVMPKYLPMCIPSDDGSGLNVGRIMGEYNEFARLHICAGIGKAIISGLYDCNVNVSRNFCHCDLKPENVFLPFTMRADLKNTLRRYSSCAMIADFNVCHITDDSKKIAESSKSQGTPYYRDFSTIIYEEQYNIFNDLWSVAVLLLYFWECGKQNKILGNAYREYDRRFGDLTDEEKEELEPYKSGSSPLSNDLFEYPSEKLFKAFLDGLLTYDIQNRYVYDIKSGKKYYYVDYILGRYNTKTLLGVCYESLTYLYKKFS